MISIKERVFFKSTYAVTCLKLNESAAEVLEIIFRNARNVFGLKCEHKPTQPTQQLIQKCFAVWRKRVKHGLAMKLLRTASQPLHVSEYESCRVAGGVQ